MILVGDCRDHMAAMDALSVDAVVCDPPYELNFMGRGWDNAGVAFDPETWRQAFRVLKPGGHLLAFGGTRTYHRMTCAIEDAGFEIRDCLSWMYGSGFPKSLDVSKAIDARLGAEREVIGNTAALSGRTIGEGTSDGFHGGIVSGHARDITAPATEEAARWDGWGTALKPAFEPVVLARKPLAGTVAASVREHGTGALNIDGCRVVGQPHAGGAHATSLYGSDGNYEPGPNVAGNPAGRWPANVLLAHTEDCVQVGTRKVKTQNPATRDSTSPRSGVIGFADSGKHYGDADGVEIMEAWDCVDSCPVAMLDAQTGDLQSPRPYTRSDGNERRDGRVYQSGSGFPRLDDVASYGDSGGASRFFFTTQKHRMEGCEHAITAAPSSSPDAAQADTARSDAAISLRPEDLSGSEPSTHLKERSTNETPTESSRNDASATQTTLNTESEFLPEPPHAGLSPTASPAKSADNQMPTGTTKTTTSHSKSGGDAEVTTSNVTSSNMEHGEKDFVGGERFRYCAKTSRAERNAGLADFESAGSPTRNPHPTVKPIAVMRWLVKLVTPPGGTILDPFLGSGTTAIAALLEGFDSVGIEQDATYAAVAEARLAFWREHGEDGLRIVAERDAVERRWTEKRAEHSDAGQLDLLGET